jgi:hypothetical protein
MTFPFEIIENMIYDGKISMFYQEIIMKRNGIFLLLLTMICGATTRPMTRATVLKAAAVTGTACVAKYLWDKYGWGYHGMEKLESRTNERIRIRNKEYTRFNPQQESNAAIIAAHTLTAQQKQQIDAILGKESVIRALTIWRHSPYSSLQYCYASYICWKYGISFTRNSNNCETFYEDWSLWRKLKYHWPDRRVFTIQDMPYYFKMGSHMTTHNDQNNFNRLVNADTIRQQAQQDCIDITIPQKWFYPLQLCNNIPQNMIPPFLIVAEKIDLTNAIPFHNHKHPIIQWIQTKTPVRDILYNGNVCKSSNGDIVIIDTEF